MFTNVYVSPREFKQTYPLFLALTELKSFYLAS